MYIFFSSSSYFPLCGCGFFLVYHTIKQAKVIAEMIATTLARATEAGPRASAPQQGRL
jgi:hypothetical protein